MEPRLWAMSVCPRLLCQFHIAGLGLQQQSDYRKYGQIVCRGQGRRFRRTTVFIRSVHRQRSLTETARYASSITVRAGNRRNCWPSAWLSVCLSDAPSSKTVRFRDTITPPVNAPSRGRRSAFRAAPARQRRPPSPTHSWTHLWF